SLIFPISCSRFPAMMSTSSSVSRPQVSRIFPFSWVQSPSSDSLFISLPRNVSRVCTDMVVRHPIACSVKRSRAEYWLVGHDQFLCGPAPIPAFSSQVLQLLARPLQLVLVTRELYAL